MNRTIGQLAILRGPLGAGRRAWPPALRASRRDRCRLHVAGVLVAENAQRRDSRAGLPDLGTAAEDDRTRWPVELGDGDHHRRFDRDAGRARSAPLFQRLEFDGVRGEDKERRGRQNLFGGFGVVVGRSTDKREAGERDDGVDSRTPLS